MHYAPGREACPLPFSPFKSCTVPRPIGWISTVDGKGRANLAPYSFFNLVASGPSIVAFSSAGRKDSQTNAEQTGEFVCNIASFDQREAVNSSAATLPPEVITALWAIFRSQNGNHSPEEDRS